MLGAIIGAQIAVDIKGETFNKILAVVMLFVVAFLVLQGKKKQQDYIERLTGKYFWASIIAFFFIGIYGGFIQAGTGFLMLLALSGINHYSLVKSNAIKVIVALIYTLSAVVIFIVNDKVNWEYGLILALGNASGGWIGKQVVGY